MNNKSIGNKGLETLKKAEGFMPTLYNDAGETEGHCTIGYGHLLHYNPCDSKSFPEEKPFISGISPKKGEQLLKEDLNFAEKAVNELVKAPLNQNQFDALVIFVFNIRRSKFADSMLLKRLNEGDCKSVPSELRRWIKSSGKVMPGLINRREMEVKLFEAR